MSDENNVTSEAIKIKVFPVKPGVWHNVYRPWETLARDSIWLMGKPVTIDHPQDGVTAGSFIVGQVMNVYVDSDQQQIICDVVLWKDRLPKEIEQKIENKEPLDVSVGYYAVTEPTSGEIDGKIYNAVEKQIYFDHLAIVTKGECSAADGCGINIMNACNCKNIKVMSMTEEMKKIYVVPKIVKDGDQIKVQAEETETPPENMEQVLQDSVMQLLNELKEDLMKQIQALTEQNAQLTEALKKATEEKEAVEKEGVLSELSQYVTQQRLEELKTANKETLRVVLETVKSIQTQDKKTPIVIPEEKRVNNIDDVMKSFKKALGFKN